MDLIESRLGDLIASSLSHLSNQAHDFEKDDDTNFHIDFLTAQCPENLKRQ